MDTLDPTKPQKVTYCIDVRTRDTQIRSNLKKTTKRLDKPIAPPVNPKVAIVGYGPSLHTTWKTLWKKLAQYDAVITVSGAHKFLVEKGIKPTYHVEVDPREHKITLLGKPIPECTYLPASCVHPKYVQHLLDHGVETRLWHVFARDGESDRIIPRGEWSLTGGCDVGMRAMTLARFLGYTVFDIYGMDGCSGATGVHAAAHPNQPKKFSEVTVRGKRFQTTPALLESARMVFHELNQMPDVKFKFHGSGLIQEMAKDYIRAAPHQHGPGIAVMASPVITEDFRALNAQLHADNPYYGIGGAKYAKIVRQLHKGSVQSVLDYGCGKGYLAKELEFPIWQYDPAVEEFAEPPRPADLVVCTDVLEHIEPECLDAVLADLARVTKQVGYFVIHMGAARKFYADGRNTHLIQKPADWWSEKLSGYFKVAKVITSRPPELHVIVGPKGR